MKSLFSRRLFLQTTAAAGAGLVIGCQVPPPETPPEPGKQPEPPKPKEKTAEPAGPPFAPNAWVRVAPDGTVTLVLDRAEMGQGVETALPMLIAEELEVELSAVRITPAPVDPAYKNRLFGLQATGGSTSIRAAWEPLRQAGAAARLMLIGAAARTWSVEPSTCRAEKGEVIHTPSGRRLGYGALVAEAAKSELPKDPPLKSPKDFHLIGKRTQRLDQFDKAAGRAVFGIDVKQPNMLTAVVARPPAFGGKLVKFDGAKSSAIKGVKKVFQIEGGVAVVAEGFWPAKKGVEALVVEWDGGKNAQNSSEKITEQAIALAKKPGAVAKKTGDAEKALKTAAKKLEAVYEVPFQAHAAMEPLSTTVLVKDDACILWTPTQFPEATRGTAAKITGLDPAKIEVNTTFLGGAFGRKFEQDFIAEAVQVAKEMRGTPIKLAWSREDDMRHDYYRPASYNVFRGGIGKDNMPVAWTHRIVSPSIMSRVFPNTVKDGVDHSSVEGAADLQYGVPNLLVDYHIQDAGVPVGFWRSVGHSQNAFVTEGFIDELAALGKQDPFEVRRKLLAGQPRLRAALELAAEKAGWGKPLAEGLSRVGSPGRGIAAHISFGSYVAQVAEVAVDKDGNVKVMRVVCAIDCGAVVNPDTVEAQVEGGIVYGLTAALKGQITIENGGAKQANFHNFKLLTMDEMPIVEVHIVPSTEAPGGVGEPGTPPIAPAVANAIFAATGKRIRRLPIRPQDLKKG